MRRAAILAACVARLRLCLRRIEPLAAAIGAPSLQMRQRGHTRCKPRRRMAVLVTGGAGFIGSHMVACLGEAGRDVVVIDDLSSGHSDDVPAEVPLIIADVADE